MGKSNRQAGEENRACRFYRQGREGCDIIFWKGRPKKTMPTVSRIGRFRFFFFSNEGNESPHIHVEKAENYAKFWLSPVALARSILDIEQGSCVV